MYQEKKTSGLSTNQTAELKKVNAVKRMFASDDMIHYASVIN
jgi:hypothetical protein